MYGNSFESSLVAVVNPNKQALERWAESNGFTADFTSICEDPKAKEFILGELTKTGKEKKASINRLSANMQHLFRNDVTCTGLGRSI